MSLDSAAFETLVPSRFITFTFPNPFHSATHPHLHLQLHAPLLRVAALDSPTQPTTTNPPQIAAMLVPPHRETDWIFSTEAGHLQLLLNSPEVSRLILIGNLPTDPPPATYNRPAPIDPARRSELEESLTPLLVALAPKSAFKNGLPEIPFLSYEDDVIRSVIVDRRVGPRVGEMLVEDVELEEVVCESEGKREFRRRLRFKRMPNLIQTQIRIHPNNRNPSDIRVLVHPYLTPMVAALSLMGSHLEEIIRCGIMPKALCLGVGGGALLTFLNTQLGFEVLGVEMDEDVLSVARKHFGLFDSPYIHLSIGDGIELIEKLADQFKRTSCDVDGFNAKFDVLMVDLDSGDAGMGAMAPPLEFVEESVLFAARLVLSEPGILVINVIPLSRSFYETLVLEFRKVFSELYEIDVGNGENFVLIATTLPVGNSSDDSKNDFLAKLNLVISGAYMDSIRKI